MQRRRRRTEITVTEETIIQRASPTAKRWCDQCQAHVSVAGTEAAAELVGTSLQDLKRGIASGEVHLWSHSGGSVQICLKSALRWAENSRSSM